MSTQTYHHKDLRAALIKNGLTLLDTEGYQSFSLRKVAALCGVSQTAPYRHFKNKDDLISAITGQALEKFAKRLEAAVARFPSDPVEQLREMGVAYIRFFAENPEYLRLLFLSDNRLRTRIFKNNPEVSHVDPFGILCNVTGLLSAQQPETGMTHEEMILYSWGLVHGISTLIASGEIQNNDVVLARAERVVRGIF